MASALEAIDAASEAVRARTGGFRVTFEDLKARVADVEYIHREHLTICVIKVDNGFYLVGKSAPVDPSNYDEAHGRQLAQHSKVPRRNRDFSGLAAGEGVRDPISMSIWP